MRKQSVDGALVLKRRSNARYLFNLCNDALSRSNYHFVPSNLLETQPEQAEQRGQPLHICTGPAGRRANRSRVDFSSCRPGRLAQSVSSELRPKLLCR